LQPEEQAKNREELVKKIESAKQMYLRAFNTRLILVIILFLSVSIILFSGFWFPIVYIAGAIIVIISVYFLKQENDFIGHLTETYGLKK